MSTKLKTCKDVELGQLGKGGREFFEAKVDTRGCKMSVLLPLFRYMVVVLHMYNPFGILVQHKYPVPSNSPPEKPQKKVKKKKHYLFYMYDF